MRKDRDNHVMLQSKKTETTMLLYNGKNESQQFNMITPKDKGNSDEEEPEKTKMTVFTNGMKRQR